MLPEHSGTLSTLIATGGGVSLLLGRRLIPQLLLLTTIGFLATGKRYKWLYILYKTLPRDLLALYCFLWMNFRLWWWTKRKMTLPQIFNGWVQTQPKKVAFLYEDEEWTYTEVDELSNQVGNYFKEKGFKRGDTVALFMESQPTYVCIWLGLAKIGVVAALINSNLRKAPLVHSIKTAHSKAIIYSSELSAGVEEVRSEISNLPLFQYNATTSPQISLLEGATDARKTIAQASIKPHTEEMAKAKPSDKLVYIFTSGTTGLPKAAVINHLRFMFMATGVNHMLRIRQDDIIYDPLPLYHSAGGMIGIGQVLLWGATVAIRKKFSASNFWTDCIKYKCTVAQYIGEICRYLLSVAEKPVEKQHKVRLMFGNGLRPQIWENFVDRFNVAQIGEFYGATEGNSNLININSTVGAVGFFPRYAGAVYPVGLIRVNEETEEAIRGEDGLCIPCQPGEPGIFVGKIIASRPHSAFSGYSDKAASEKKILNDVFKRGDKVFNSGDILVMDELGYFFFKDRTGDTFRWRGENVATSEVEAVISNVVGLKDAAVYGVEIPNLEGKAGMAAIVDPDDKLDMEGLARGIRQSLPAYARPLFIRVLKELPMTGTYKLKKRDLQMEGYDPNKLNDALYYMESTGTYVPLTKQLYTDIISGKVRL